MDENMETYQEFELYKAQIKTLSENLELIELSILELNKVNQGLNIIKEAEEGSEILVPMGPDAFIKATVTDTKNVIIGIGSGVSAKKTVDEALLDLDERLKGLENVKKKSEDKLMLYTQKIEELAPRVQKMMAELQKEG